MATLIAHYDASLLGLADGAAVSSLPDLQGIQGAYTPSLGTPVYRAAAQNGLGVVDCTTGGEAMNSTWATVPTQPCTLMLAGKLNSLTTTDFWNHQTFAFGAFTNASVWALISAGTLVDGSADTGFHVFTFMLNGATSIIRIDGVQVAAGSAGTSAAAGTLSQLKGPFRHGEIYFFNGDATADPAEAALIAKWITPPAPRNVAGWMTRSGGR